MGSGRGAAGRQSCSWRRSRSAALRRAVHSRMRLGIPHDRDASYSGIACFFAKAAARVGAGDAPARPLAAVAATSTTVVSVTAVRGSRIGLHALRGCA